MTTFDKREEGFEKKFAIDEELKFKANARRNRLLGLWAASAWHRMGQPENVRLIEIGPGRGTMMLDALRARDASLVAGCAAAGSIFLAFGTLVSDAAAVLVNPRIRE